MVWLGTPSETTAMRPPIVPPLWVMPGNAASPADVWRTPLVWPSKYELSDVSNPVRLAEATDYSISR